MTFDWIRISGQGSPDAPKIIQLKINRFDKKCLFRQRIEIPKIWNRPCRGQLQSGRSWMKTGRSKRTKLDSHLDWKCTVFLSLRCELWWFQHFNFWIGQKNFHITKSIKPHDEQRDAEFYFWIILFRNPTIPGLRGAKIKGPCNRPISCQEWFRKCILIHP